MAIKVMLVEDEPGIRKILRKIIEKTNEFEVIGECESMTQAIVMFHHDRPDVIFMDIEIEGSSGLECAKVITDMEPKTKIVFATAHSEYMSDAFGLYAFDYLIKPFHLERVERTLERIKYMEHYKEVEENNTVHKISLEQGNEKILVKGKECISFVDTDEIIVIQRENNSTVIYTNTDTYVTSAGMGDIESKLDIKTFMRCHKSYIINVSKIKRIEPYGRWTYIVHFKNTDRDALMTREKYEEIKIMFE